MTIMSVSKVCPVCGGVSVIDIPEDAYNKWQTGELIQDAWPEGTPSEREVLISGLCKICQIETFGEEDD